MSSCNIPDTIAKLAHPPERFREILAKRYYVPFLPLLECRYQVVTDTLGQSLLDAGLIEEDYHNISLSELAVCALQSESDYWAKLAVQWLEEGFPLDNQIVQAIDTMVRGKHASQTVRHRAFRLARRWGSDKHDAGSL